MYYIDQEQKDDFKFMKEVTKNRNLNYDYMKLLNRSKELLETNLSFDELVSVKSLLKLSEEMSPIGRIKFAKTIINYYQAEIASAKMKDISKLIDNFINDKEGITSDEIEREINSIPESRLFLTNTEEKEKIYNEYGKKFYEFALYLCYKEYPMFTKEQLNFIDKYAKEDLEKIHTEENIPYDLNKAIYESSSNHDVNLLRQLYLYKYRNEILVAKYPRDINEKLNETLRLQGDIKASKSRIKKLVAKIVLITTLTVGTVTLIPAMIYSEKDKNPYKKTVEINIDDEITNKDIKQFPILRDTILKEYYNTTRKYVTVFGNTIGEKVQVKVYDYTDTNYTDEELKTIELDEHKIIFDDNVYVDRAKASEVYGKYTGKAHRDVSSVKFNKEDNTDPFTAAFCAFIILVLIISALGSKGLFDRFEEIIKEIKEEKKFSEETIQELSSLLDTLASLENKRSSEFYGFANNIDSIDTRAYEQAVLENSGINYNYKFASDVEGSVIKPLEQETTNNAVDAELESIELGKRG